jgi:hypothetical protein
MDLRKVSRIVLHTLFPIQSIKKTSGMLTYQQKRLPVYKPEVPSRKNKGGHEDENPYFIHNFSIASSILFDGL